MENPLKRKRNQLLFVLFVGFAFSLGSSYGVNSSIDHHLQSSCNIQKSCTAPTDSDESALASEIQFAKAVILMVKKVFSTRL